MIPDADYLPTAELHVLRLRSRLLQQVRDFFTGHDYWEVQTPILSRDCCIDQWLDPFCVELGQGERGYLQTSPEFALKRLVCAGAERVFEIARVFRQDEIGVRHNPEFTMIEWYARDTDHHAQMDFVESLIRSLHASTAQNSDAVSARPIPDLFHRMTYEDAFLKFANVSPSSGSNAELLAAAKQRTSAIPQGIDEDREGLLNFLIAEVVEPELKQLQAVFIYDFPAAQAALARTRPGNPPVAERFELYLDGMEICNGYHELTDPAVLRQRMREQNARRVAMGKPGLPETSRLIDAMEAGMPACSGVALGFDRLAMWILGLESVRDVIAFPFDRA